MPVPTVVRYAIETLRIPWYARSQRYAAEYRAEISNSGEHAADVTVVCPLPPSLPYQRVGSLTYASPPSGAGVDPASGNHYAWWTPYVPRQGKASVSFQFPLTVVPRLGLTPADGGAPAAVQSAPNRFFAVTGQIRQIARQVGGENGPALAVVQRLYAHVVRTLHYGNPIPGLYSARDALQLPAVDCGGFCSLLAALLAAKNIPTRLLVGFLVGYQRCGMHVWLEARLSGGQWLPLDPTHDHLYRAGRDRKSGRFGFVGSDRIVFSVGADWRLSVAGTDVPVVILQHPVVVNPSGRAVTATAVVTARRL